MPHLPQFAVVLSGAQVPLQHPSPAAQALPHLPQFAVVVSGVQTPGSPQQPSFAPHSAAVQQLVIGMQAPLQSLKPVSHSNPHVPLLALHVGWALATFVVQTLPQLPQFAIVLLTKQTPAQQI